MLNACIEHDTTPSRIREKYKYAGWNSNITEDTKKAVEAVFYDGYKVVKQHIKYFYAPALCNSEWHETQVFIIEYGAHRFFVERA
jgi:spore germination cell wall hydrolase CwlJ-like protein